MSKHSFRFFSNDVRWEKPLENSDFAVRRRKRREKRRVNALVQCYIALPSLSLFANRTMVVTMHFGTMLLLSLSSFSPPFFIAPLLSSVVARPSMLWSGASPPTHRRRKKKKEALILIALHACLGGKNLTCTHLDRKTRDSLVISYSALRTV